MRHPDPPARGSRNRTSRPVSEASVRPAWLALVAVAFLLALLGGGLLVYQRSTIPTDHMATVGGLSVQLHGAGWVSMDGHDQQAQGGYQMPAQMMPGAPAGDDMRFGVPLTLVNTSGGVLRFSLAEEFRLRGGHADEPRTPHSDTFGQLNRLGPGSAVDGVLYFDTVVPNVGDPPLYLEWQRDGDATRLTIPMLAGATPGHGHPR